MRRSAEPRLLLVTGLSGAGKSTVLKVLEDLGWEVVDNLPLSLLEALIAAPAKGSNASRPLAVGIDSRQSGFQAQPVGQTDQVAARGGRPRRPDIVHRLRRRPSSNGVFSETRRRHPLAEDRPAADGIAREREMMESLRRWAEHVIDTTNYSSNDLQQEVPPAALPTPRATSRYSTSLSFGFARGLPRNADLVFDMRYLRNPHWGYKAASGDGGSTPMCPPISSPTPPMKRQWRRSRRC